MATLLVYICRLALFLTIKSNLLHSQQFTISFQRPADCGVEQFYDISSLSCVKCGPNQRTSATGLSCECVTGFRVLATNGASITCQQCPLEKRVCSDSVLLDSTSHHIIHYNISYFNLLIVHRPFLKVSVNTDCPGKCAEHMRLVAP
ncbi:unnamed protein product [Coregonus sp. 'balchen']|nr:unnamed protein product [Coregonus sp. 'balchen']